MSQPAMTIALRRGRAVGSRQKSGLRRTSHKASVQERNGYSGKKAAADWIEVCQRIKVLLVDGPDHGAFLDG